MNMLKKYISVLLLVFTFSLELAAQQPVKRDEKIRQLKIEFVTSRMSLTQQQMQRFVPLYNRYSDDLLVYRRAIKDLEKNPNSQYQVEERQKLEQKMVEIKGTYKDDFLRIITAQQLASMYKAEGEFKKAVLEEYRKRNSR